MNPYLQDINKFSSVTQPIFLLNLLLPSILASKTFISSPSIKHLAPGFGLNALIFPKTSFAEILNFKYVSFYML